MAAVAVLTNSSSLGPLIDAEEERKWLKVSMRVARRGKAERPEIRPLPEMAHLSDHLYIGTYADARDSTLLDKFHITHILNCGSGECGSPPEVKGRKIKLMQLCHPVRDHPNLLSDQPDEAETASLGSDEENLLDGEARGAADSLPPRRQGALPCEGPNWLSNVFVRSCDFIEKAAATPNGRILLCCLCGVNRGPAIAAAYLMWKKQWTLLESLEKIRASRGVVLQVEAIQMQLVTFAAKEGLLGHADACLAADDPSSSESEGDEWDLPENWDDRLLADDADRELSDLDSSASSSNDGLATHGSDDDLVGDETPRRHPDLLIPPAPNMPGRSSRTPRLPHAPGHKGDLLR